MGKDYNNDNLKEVSYPRKMSTIKITTIYDKNENIINIAEDEYIKNKTEEIFGESLHYSNNKNYEYEFISTKREFSKNKMQQINEKDEDLNSIENNAKYNITLTNSTNKKLDNITKLNNNGNDNGNDNGNNNGNNNGNGMENPKDINQILIDKYYNEYCIGKEKILTEHDHSDDSNMLNDDDSQEYGTYIYI